MALPRANLYTGRAITKRVKSRHYDDSRNEEPKVLRDAVMILEGNQVPFNRKRIEQHLAKLKQTSEEAAAKFGRESREYRKKHADT